MFQKFKLNLFLFFTFNELQCALLYESNALQLGNCDDLSLSLKSEIRGYQPIVNKIVKTVTQGKFKGQTWEELATFIDKFGSRISGSENLENAIDYMLQRSSHYNLDRIHGEPVTVPHWVRGKEEAILLKPRHFTLNIMGLGGSVATPKEGITAPVMVVESFEELKNRSMEAKGKIVVFAETYVSYGKSVVYRQYAAVRAAEVGAVASLVRSITPFSINSPHTGWQDYSEKVKKIPTAAITVEDAQWLLRMHRRGIEIEIKLYMEAHTLPSVQSRNTVVEVSGSKDPEKFVLISGHLDSWDVGQGAMDDGAGAFISWYSTVVLKKLGLRPKRTVRAVLWSGEEEGLIGAFAFRAAHNKSDIVILMESDEGTFMPQGLTFKGTAKAKCIIQEILKLLEPLGTNQLVLSDDVGSDIMVWANDGIPLASLKNANERYFWFHHSDGDTMAVENPDVLDKCTALWASVAYILADMSIMLPR
ncbi:carboxypeptidase Q-like [Rhodnius prolixus]|uniref:Carboxypeptidase Q n=1 Tax=Rhodnius prolixus TaxID=13249 RepID=R4G3P4_RHOPR